MKMSPLSFFLWKNYGCLRNFLIILLTTHFQLSSTIVFLPDVPYSCCKFPPGHTDGRTASSVAKCGADQAWQCHCQSFALSSPLISDLDFNFFFFGKLFPSFGPPACSIGATLSTHVWLVFGEAGCSVLQQ